MPERKLATNRSQRMGARCTGLALPRERQISRTAAVRLARQRRSCPLQGVVHLLKYLPGGAMDPKEGRSLLVGPIHRVYSHLSALSADRTRSVSKSRLFSPRRRLCWVATLICCNHMDLEHIRNMRCETKYIMAFNRAPKLTCLRLYTNECGKTPRTQWVTGCLKVY